jgi:hypothetical protein
MNKRIKLFDEGNVYIVVEETETTVTYRKHFTKNPRNFVTINKKYVKFI